MIITVKLFAILRDKAGVSELRIELPKDATISSASEALAAQLPALRDHLRRVAYALNREYAAKDATLSDGDELALIPPVSGGTA
jgi:molybdopterin synthase catalytic subunit